MSAVLKPQPNHSRLTVIWDCPTEEDNVAVCNFIHMRAENIPGYESWVHYFHQGRNALDLNVARSTSEGVQESVAALRDSFVQYAALCGKGLWMVESDARIESSLFVHDTTSLHFRDLMSYDSDMQ